MEIKVNLLNLDNAKNALSQLKSEMDTNFPDKLINISVGQACDQVNNMYNSLNKTELALLKLIETTQTCVNNGRIVVTKTDTELGNIYEKTYSGYISSGMPSIK